jgi:ArsR family transcriptional regulator, arsenate/arsenite/antimonite-responsive transcriptional repressor
MRSAEVIASLGALAHEHRLAVYRLLIKRGPEGLPAGVIGGKLGLGPSSLTFHLQALHRAGLVRQVREGRQLIYSADFTAMSDLVSYLTDECCAAATGCNTDCAPARAVAKARPTRAA